jgi:predicted dithiol-disulfide oxidoreductase (DUF899 family)
MVEAGAPPIIERLAAECGTDPTGYMTERQALLAFAVEDGVVYQTYSAFARGVEIMMGFYALLDRAPNGRNESADSEFWIRRHDEYPVSGDGQDAAASAAERVEGGQAPSPRM